MWELCLPLLVCRLSLHLRQGTAFSRAENASSTAALAAEGLDLPPRGNNSANRVFSRQDPLLQVSHRSAHPPRHPSCLFFVGFPRALRTNHAPKTNRSLISRERSLRLDSVLLRKIMRRLLPAFFRVIHRN